MREKRSTALRKLLKQGKTLVKPGAFNAMSAMIIKQLEEEFLPSAEVIAKYEGAVGFQP